MNGDQGGIVNKPIEQPAGKDTILKDFITATFEVGKAQGYKMGFDDGCKQTKMDFKKSFGKQKGGQ